jgi:16S rRNA (cytosine967-C5)-methyltransferase
VPCSGLGVLRRLPDTKWRCHPPKIDNLITIQRRILERNAPLVKTGGRLVYATCSILPTENEQQIQWFLDRHQGWKLQEEHHWRPDRENTDGFYAARLVKLT